MTMEQLYDRAYEQGIRVDDFRFDAVRSMAVPGAIALDMSQMETTAMAKTDLAHELGHEETGSFYYEGSGLDDRDKCEYKANKRAAEHMIMPFDEVLQAVTEGYEMPWQLAEYFDVTEEFAAKTLKMYEDRLRNAIANMRETGDADISYTRVSNGSVWVPELGMHMTVSKYATDEDIKEAIEIMRGFEKHASSH